MAKRHLTAAFVKNAKPAPDVAQTDYFDTAVPGFGLRATAVPLCYRPKNAGKYRAGRHDKRRSRRPPVAAAWEHDAYV